MQPILVIKENRWINFATILFLLGLAAFVPWLDNRLNGVARAESWVFSTIMAACCFFPISDLCKPKFWSLAIDGDSIIWSGRSDETEKVFEERIPLHQIRKLEFVIPEEVGAKRSKSTSCAELRFVTNVGPPRYLPSGLLAGVYRDRIVKAIRHHIPDVEIKSVRGSD